MIGGGNGDYHEQQKQSKIFRFFEDWLESNNNNNNINNNNNNNNINIKIWGLMTSGKKKKQKFSSTEKCLTPLAIYIPQEECPFNFNLRCSTVCAWLHGLTVETFFLQPHSRPSQSRNNLFTRLGYFWPNSLSLSPSLSLSLSFSFSLYLFLVLNSLKVDNESSFKVMNFTKKVWRNYEGLRNQLKKRLSSPLLKKNHFSFLNLRNVNRPTINVIVFPSESKLILILIIF